MSKRDRDVLSDAVGRMVELKGNAVSVTPDSVATGAMQLIRFDYGVHNAGWYGCYQHMLELARARLRGRYDPAARAKAYTEGQSELFDDKLQDRYPRRPRREFNGSWADPEYVLRSHLNAEDRWFNIDRLRHVSGAAAKHSDALEAETVELFGPRGGPMAA